ncbi:amino acid permease [Paraburkholderia tropica]|uniref:amino acid permease n=1 Tax=Paraburkholderia tropica TaxID=92647 RepID=UPI002AB652EF|nr:amino acid permease [Paraburkholderia tropica]
MADLSQREGSGLHRGLENRHIQLISIGGAIGTGLFLGAGKTISVSGTSVIATYAIIGFFLFFLMRAMGEILLADLRFKSFVDFCSHYVGPWAGFFVGWSYWLAWTVGAVADCAAVSGYLQLWFPTIPGWIPAFSVLAFILAMNLVAVRMFGELEFWFVLVKVVAIVSLIVVGLSMVLVSYTSPSGVHASLGHLFERKSFLPHGIMGFLAGFQIAIFSFGGIELVGTTAAEAKDPHKTLPRAINSVPIRVLVFYVLSLATIISVSSWQGITATRSPFVQVFLLAGLPAAASIINLVVVISAMSAANSGVFATSRMLFGMAASGQGIRSLNRLSRKSVPMRSLFFSGAFMAAGLSLLFIFPSIMEVFTILSTVSAILFIFVWTMILIAYLCYRKSSNKLHVQSNFKMPGGKIMASLCLLFFATIIVVLAMAPDTARGLGAMPIWFLTLLFFYRRRTNWSTKTAVANIGPR